MNEQIDWNEEELDKWLGTKGESTEATYRFAFQLYQEFTEKTAKELIDEAEQDDKLPKRKRGRVKRRILRFQKWLLEEYVTPREREKAKKDKSYEPDVGAAPKSAATYIGAIRGFYSDNGFTYKFKTGRIKRAHPKTGRELIKPKELKLMLSAAHNHRDKAIIMCLYQSGMDISTLLSLNYKDVKRRIESNDAPLMVELVRRKTGQPYKTFFGKDAVVYLTNYLKEREVLNGKLKLKDPLFVTRKTETPKRLKVMTATDIFQSLVKRAGLITKEEMEAETINPYGTHALRASFSKIAKTTGLSDDLVDFFLGHETPFHGAYSELPDEELTKLYKQLEPHLTVSGVIESEMDQLKAHARTVWGIDLEKVIADKAQEILNSGLGGGKSMKDPAPNLEDPTVVAELLRSEIKQRILPNNYASPELTQKIIHQDELEAYMAKGWLFKAALNNGTGKVIVEKGVKE